MYILLPKSHTVQPARNLHLNTRHRDLPQRVRWKWPPWSVFFADISVGHRCLIAHGSEHRATRCTNTADPDGRTRWSLILYYLHVQCRRWKTVDCNDPSRATTASPRVRSSRYARVMTTGVNWCSAAVFDRAWIILTTGVRGFMKVPRWLYCKSQFCHISVISRAKPWQFTVKYLKSLKKYFNKKYSLINSSHMEQQLSNNVSGFN